MPPTSVSAHSARPAAQRHDSRDSHVVEGRVVEVLVIQRHHARAYNGLKVQTSAAPKEESRGALATLHSRRPSSWLYRVCALTPHWTLTALGFADAPLSLVSLAPSY